MESKILDGVKFGLGIVISLVAIFGFVSAAGFHYANEIVPGAFQDGNYSFNGSLNVSTGRFSVDDYDDGIFDVMLGGTDGGGVVWLRNNSDYNVQIVANGNSYFNGGNVGIGTSSPSAKLHVKGYMNIENSDSHLKLTGSLFNGVVQVFNDRMIIGNWNVPNNGININLSNGNVGIGTSSPQAKLDVFGISPVDANGAHFRIISTDGAGGLYLGVVGDSRSFIQSHGNKPLVLNELGNNVGIGTINPQAKLDVAGHIQAEPVIGEWRPSAHGTSYTVNVYNLVKLDSELINTAPDYFTSDGVGTITIHKAGYYRANVHAMSYNDAGMTNHVSVLKNGGTIYLSHARYSSALAWNRHEFDVVSYFNVGDTLKLNVYCSSTTNTYCYHGGSYYTGLVLTKIN